MTEITKNGAAPGAPDPELVERAQRRRYSAEHKLRIVREADACTAPGEVGALLRREGLYTSHLTYWRKQRDAGALDALGRPRGRKPGDRRDSRSTRAGRCTWTICAICNAMGASHSHEPPPDRNAHVQTRPAPRNPA